MADLPRIEDVLREQAEANALMLASDLRWVARCSGCGVRRVTEESNGMPAGHELRRAGWTTGAEARTAFCPGCSLF